LGEPKTWENEYSYSIDGILNWWKEWGNGIEYTEDVMEQVE